MKIKTINIKDSVYCDLCNESYPEGDKREGGYYFTSKAVCPLCADRFEKSAIKYKEEHFITKRAKKGQTFRDFVIDDLRGGKDGTIEISTWD
jgi:hypothetical protein